MAVKKSTDSIALPVLYSFRRCPYAIRARMALYASATPVYIREVVLRDKPASMLQCSPKGTVPVLLLANAEVIDESLDILHWALNNNDPRGWLQTLSPSDRACADQLISTNDTVFKSALDRYKYSDRYPEHTALDYRRQGEAFLGELEQRLQSQPFLLSNKISFADIAIFPFIRQFAFVDKQWFDQSVYGGLQRWLENFLNSAIFQQIMIKLPPWQEGDIPRLFSPDSLS